MLAIINNQEFPFKNPAGKESTTTCFMQGTAFIAVYWLADISDSECQEWTSGIIEYGVYVQEGIPFPLFGFPNGGLYFDLSINVWQELEKHKALCNFLEGTSDMIHVCLVDAHDNICRSVRGLQVGPTAANLIRTTCRQQLQTYKNAQAVGTAIDRILEKVSIQEMLQKVQRYRPM